MPSAGLPYGFDEMKTAAKIFRLFILLALSGCAIPFPYVRLVFKESAVMWSMGAQITQSRECMSV